MVQYIPPFNPETASVVAVYQKDNKVFVEVLPYEKHALVLEDRKKEYAVISMTFLPLPVYVLEEFLDRQFRECGKNAYEVEGKESMKRINNILTPESFCQGIQGHLHDFHTGRKESSVLH